MGRALTNYRIIRGMQLKEDSREIANSLKSESSKGKQKTIKTLTFGNVHKIIQPDSNQVGGRRGEKRQVSKSMVDLNKERNKL